MKHKKDWSHLAEVTVKYANGKEFVFPSLKDAILYVGYSEVKRLKVGRLGTCGDEVAFFDELGMMIPLWRVKEEMSLIDDKDYPNFRYWSYWRQRSRQAGFRNGPVPNTRCFRGGSGWYRSIRTTQEIRENDFLDYDEDAEEYYIKARGPRRNLPTVWDDSCRHRERNWKSQRRTQWR